MYTSLEMKDFIPTSFMHRYYHRCLNWINVQILFIQVPMYPTPSRWWEIIEKHKVSIFYTAPTAIRSLEALGDKVLDLSFSIRENHLISHRFYSNVY